MKMSLFSRCLPALALALVLGMFINSPAVADEEKVLNLYAWSEYMPQESLDNFTKETGIKVYNLDPAVIGPFEPDAYIKIMEENLKTLQEALH